MGDTFIISKRFLPFGNSERGDTQRRNAFYNILKTPMKYYVSKFLHYFLNDEYSLKQYIRHSSLKPSNENALLKYSSLESTQTFNPDTHLKGQIDTNQNGDTNDLNYHHTKHHETTNHEESKTMKDENGECFELYERIIGVSKIDEINKMIDNELSDHYFKVSNYQSFFIDVTKLLTSSPKIGLDLLDAPKIILNILDHKIVPLFYSTIEKLSTNNKSMGVSDLLSLCKSLPPDLTSEEDDVTVSKFLEFALGEANLNKNFKNFENHQTKNQFKFNLTTRLKNIPLTSNIWKRTVNEICDDDVGTMISITATVVLTGVLNILEEEREYKCKKCHKSFICKGVPESQFLINIPFRCPNLNQSNTQKCDGTMFIKGQYHKRSDYQEIRCQSISNISSGMNMNTMIPVVLRREIAGTCFPGDTVHIVAFVSRRWKRLKRGERCDLEIFLDAVNVEIVNWHISRGMNLCESTKENRYEVFWSTNRNNEVLARNRIIDGVNPSLVNIDNAKLALVLTLIGGFLIDDLSDDPENKVMNRWAKYSEDNKNNLNNFQRNDLRGYLCSNTSDISKESFHSKKGGSRTQCHILLVGDPGTGKSQLLKCAGDISFRHVAVSGTNCTSVGLTCTLVRDGPEVMLAAGALVLAAGGVCCIDEFASIRSGDKSCLHEAMEQQKISVAKAGIKCTLNCQCSIVAASNFKPSRYRCNTTNDSSKIPTNESKVLNIDIPLPLLSRFDMILVFFDNSSSDVDLSEFLLNENMKQGKLHTSDDPMLLDWSIGTTLKEYIAFVKENFFPRLSNASKVLIHAYYLALRKCSVESNYGGGPTMRSLESLVRLSQAHARLMYRNVVTLFDTVSIIWVNEFGLQGYCIGCNNGNEQILDRQGLFPDIKDIFENYSRNNQEDERTNYKFGNGIRSNEMYEAFENLLLCRLGLVKSYSQNQCEVILTNK